MRQTEVKVNHVTHKTGIKLGNPKAKKVLVEFINVRCPFCRQWWDEKSAFLNELSESGDLLHIIKPFNKEKPGLDMGNIMHQYIPNDDSAIQVIDAIYETQDIWGDLDSFEMVEDYAENTLNLTRQNNDNMLADIVEEANKANVVFVPTVIVGDAYFDQKISMVELKDML